MSISSNSISDRTSGRTSGSTQSAPATALQSSIMTALTQASTNCRSEDWAAVVKNCEEAIAQAQEALTAQSNESNHQLDYEKAQISLAQSLRQAGDIDGAVKVYLAGLQKNPRWYTAYNRLRYNLMRYDIPADAPILETIAAACREIVEQYPNLQAAQVTLGYALTKLGKVQAATDCYGALSDRLFQVSLQKLPDGSVGSSDRTPARASVAAEGSSPSSQRRKPSFMIVGAEKCGTTSLFQYLRHHPAVLSPIEKEIDFFDMEYDCGLDWYLSHFPPVSSQHGGTDKIVTGETSANYLYSDVVPARVFTHFPQIQLVAILRHPVDRTISRYGMMVRNGAENRSFEAAVTEEMQLIERATVDGIVPWVTLNRCRHVGNSLYYYHLQRWLSYFSREQLLVLQSEALFSHPEKTLQQLYSCLGLSELSPSTGESKPAARTYPKYNSGIYSSTVSNEIRHQLFDFFEPHTQKLEALLGQSFGWQRS